MQIEQTPVIHGTGYQQRIVANGRHGFDAEIQLIRSRHGAGKTVDDLDLDIAVTETPFRSSAPGGTADGASQ